VYKRQFYQIVESNRIELFFPESECSSPINDRSCCLHSMIFLCYAMHMAVTY